MRKTKLEKGQTLVAIVLLSVLALSIGVYLSNRYISSLKSFSRSDDSVKALAVAEAAVERVLLIPNDTLEDYITFNSCGDDCHLEISDANGQTLTADVVLSFAGNTSEAFDSQVQTDSVFQVNMDGYTSGETVDICWNNQASIFAIYTYKDGDSIEANDYAYNSINTEHFDNDFDLASSRNGYQSCFAITANDEPEIIRIKAFYYDTLVYVVPSPGESIPIQGILVESTGKSGESVKKVTVLKTSAIAPELFDYAVLQRSTDDPLSNRID